MSLLEAMPVKIPDLPEGFDSNTTFRDVPSHIAESAPKGKTMNTIPTAHRYGYWECVVKIPKKLVPITGAHISLDGPFGALAPILINPDKPKEIMMKFADRRGVKSHKIDTGDSIADKEFMIGICITKTKMFRLDKLEVFYNEHQVWKTEIDSMFGFGKSKWKYDMSELNELDIHFAGTWKATRAKKAKDSKINKTNIASASVASTAAPTAASTAATDVKSAVSDTKKHVTEESGQLHEKMTAKVKSAEENAKNLTKKMNEKSEKSIAAILTRTKKTKDRADSKAAKAEEKARKFKGSDAQKEALEQKAEKANLKAKQVARKADANAEKAMRKIKRRTETQKLKLKDMVADAKEDVEENTTIVKEDVQKPDKEENSSENPVTMVGNFIGGLLGTGQTNDENIEEKKDEKRSDQKDEEKKGA